MTYKVWVAALTTIGLYTPLRIFSHNAKGMTHYRTRTDCQMACDLLNIPDEPSRKHFATMKAVFDDLATRLYTTGTNEVTLRHGGVTIQHGGKPKYISSLNGLRTFCFAMMCELSIKIGKLEVERDRAKANRLRQRPKVRSGKVPRVSHTFWEQVIRDYESEIAELLKSTYHEDF